MPDSFYLRCGKRLFDAALATLGLFLALPPLAACMLLIRCTSRGPVLFPQLRVGRDGRRFVMWKLRTMARDAEADGVARFADEDDARATPVGRWLRAARLDELPQLWNVIRGEMSLCGPRPERPHFVARFEREIPGYRRRHRLRPGMTGWAQIHLGRHPGCDHPLAKTRFDLHYLAQASFTADLAILLRTPAALLRCTAALRRRPRPCPPLGWRPSENA